MEPRRKSLQKLLVDTRGAARPRVVECWSRILESLEQADSYDNRIQHAFALGVVPEEVQTLGGKSSQTYLRD